MSFTIEDYHDLARLLVEHPEWRSELRSLVLSDDLLSLPETVREIVEVQKRTEERLDQLVEAQKRTEERLDQLVEAQKRTEERVDQLAEAQKRTEERIDELAEKVVALIEQVKKLAENQLRMTNTIGDMKGRLLEITYREKAYGYFGHLLRHVRVADLSRIDDDLEKILAPSEFREVFRMDLMLNGQVRDIPGRPEIFLVLEVSSVVDGNDVDRAWRRAGLVRRAGYKVVPVAAGEEATLGAERYAKEQNVVLVQDGQVRFWDEAMSAWVKNDA